MKYIPIQTYIRHWSYLHSLLLSLTLICHLNLILLPFCAFLVVATSEKCVLPIFLCLIVLNMRPSRSILLRYQDFIFLYDFITHSLCNTWTIDTAIFIFWKQLYTVFHDGYTNLPFCKQCKTVLSLANVAAYVLNVSTNSHFNLSVIECQCGFNVHFYDS